MSSPDWKKIEIVSRGKRVKGRYEVSNGLLQSRHGMALTKRR